MADDETPADVPTTTAAREPFTAMQMEMVHELLNRSERAYERFKLELIGYNVVCLAALLLTIYSAVRTANTNFDATAMAVYLTSGGLFTVAGARITKFLSDDLKTIREIIFTILGRAA